MHHHDQTFPKHAYEIIRTNLGAQTDNYFLNLKVYDEWAGDKLLIYYEDLMNKPQEQLEMIVDFLGMNDREKLNAFLDEYDLHKKLSIDLYNTLSKTLSNGDDINFYSKIMPRKFLYELENLIQCRQPYYYQKYLIRYDSVQEKK